LTRGDNKVTTDGKEDSDGAPRCTTVRQPRPQTLPGQGGKGRRERVELSNNRPKGQAGRSSTVRIRTRGQTALGRR